MSADNTGSLILGIDTSRLKSDLKIIEGAIKLSTQKIGNLLKPLTGMLSFENLFGNYSRDLPQLKQLSRSLRENIQTVDAWSLAVLDSKGSAREFQNSLGALDDGLKDALQGGQAAESFAALGISVTDSEGRLKSVCQVLLELAGVAQNMDKGEFESLLAGLGLDEGSISMLQKGRGELEALVNAKMGTAYTDANVEAAEKYNQSLERMEANMARLSTLVMEPMANAQSVAADKIADLMELMKMNPAMGTLFSGLAMSINAGLLPALTALGKVVLAHPLGQLLGILLGLGFIVDDFVRHLKGADTALGHFWEALGFGKGTFEEFKSAYEDTLGEMLDEGAPLGNLLVILGAIVEGDFGTALERAGQMFRDFIEGVKFIFLELWDLLISFFTWLDKKLGILDKIDKVKTKISETMENAGQPVNESDGIHMRAFKFFRDTSQWLGGGIYDRFIKETDRHNEAENIEQKLLQTSAASIPGNDLASIDQSTHTDIKVDIGGVTVHTAAVNPQAVGEAVQQALSGRFSHQLARMAGTPSLPPSVMG